MDFLDNYFKTVGSKPKASSGRAIKAKTKTQRYSRPVIMALPKGTEGDWGSVNRNYIISGFKSNGDWEFVNSFPKYVLNKPK